MKIKAKILVMALVITMVGMFALPMTTPVVEAQTSPWWNANWGHRMSYTVNNGGAVATMSVPIGLNATNGFTVGYAKADGGDIRFVKNDGTTELTNYWMEYWNVAVETGGTFWLKYPDLPSGNNIVWVYYGNAAATTRSNGSNVFSVFDEFSGSDYTYRAETAISGPIDTNVMYEKSHTVKFQLDGTTYCYEENNTLSGISIAYNTTNNYLTYGSLFNDSHNYSINGAASTGAGSWSRFANNPLINISYGSEYPDSLKCMEPDWVHDMTTTYRKQIEDDGDYNFTIYYTSVNTSAYGICAATSDHTSNPDSAYTKRGCMLENDDVAWASNVRKPIVWLAGEADFRMLFAGEAGGKYNIGYATAAAILGPWTPFASSVLNVSSWGFDTHNVIPTDVWGNGTHTWMSYAGMDASNNWRQGIAVTTDSDPLIDWTKLTGFVPFGNALSSIDKDDCQYGSWNIIEKGEDNEYLNFAHTMKNATHTSMSDTAAINTTWVSYGTYRGTYCLWDMNGDGDTTLYVDTNETYLLNDYDVYTEGGGTYHNYTVSSEFWIRNAGAADNVSVVARAGGAPWATRSHYAAELEASAPQLSLIQALGGAETQLAVNTDSPGISTQNEQGRLSIYCLGDEMTVNTETMVGDATEQANSSADQHMNGEVGLLSHNCPVEFDWFRLSGYAGTTVTVTGGSEENYDEDDQGGGGGGGGVPPVDDTDDEVDDDDQEDDDEWWDVCCGSTAIIVVMPLIIGGGGAIRWFRKKYGNHDPRRKED